MNYKGDLIKLLDSYISRVVDLEEIIEELYENECGVESLEYKSELEFLTNIIQDLEHLLYGKAKEYKDKVLTFDEMCELSCDDIDFDVTFIGTDDKTYTFMNEAYTDMVDEYGREDVNSCMGRMKDMVDNGMYELIKDTNYNGS